VPVRVPGRDVLPSPPLWPALPLCARVYGATGVPSRDSFSAALHCCCCRNHARQSLIQNLDNVSAPGHRIGSHPVAALVCAAQALGLACPEGGPPFLPLAQLLLSCPLPRVAIGSWAQGSCAGPQDQWATGRWWCRRRYSRCFTAWALYLSTDSTLMHSMPARPYPSDSPCRIQTLPPFLWDPEVCA